MLKKVLNTKYDLEATVLWLMTVLVLLSVPSKAFGGVITLTTSATSIVSDDRVTLEVTTINQGDEAAGNLSLSVDFQGHVSKSALRPRLAPGERYTVKFPLEIPAGASGAYSALVLVDFHDLRGYPYSAVSHAAFVIGPTAYAEVFAKPARMVLRERGPLYVDIENTGRNRLSVLVRLAAPKELRVDPAEKTLIIEPGAIAQTVFTVDKWWAMEGSAYNVLIFIDYQNRGRHFSPAVENRVLVAEKVDFFKKNRTVLLMINAALFLAVVLVQVLDRARAGKKDIMC